MSVKTLKNRMDKGNISEDLFTTPVERTAAKIEEIKQIVLKTPGFHKAEDLAKQVGVGSSSIYNAIKKVTLDRSLFKIR